MPIPDLSRFILINLPTPESEDPDAPVKRELLVTRVCDLSELGDASRRAMAAQAIHAATAKRATGAALAAQDGEQGAHVAQAREASVETAQATWAAFEEITLATVQGLLTTWADGQQAAEFFRLRRGAPAPGFWPLVAVPSTVQQAIYTEVQAHLGSFRLPMARRPGS